MKSFVRPGDQLVRAGTADPLISAHAARRPNGDLAVLLINKDPSNARPVSLQYSGYSPAAGAPTVISFANGAPAPSTATSGSAAAQTLAPYSLTLLLLRPSGQVTGAPGAPGQPYTTAVTGSSATIAWPAAPAGQVAKYEVYRQNGTISEQLGESPGTSLQVHNLNPGTRYTVNVITRDTAGKVSWSSPPLTFTTTSPATSTCTVRFTDVTDWGNGYVGNIDITNTGASPINGWTLTFTWPTAWQTVNGSWNGTWTQTGRDVKITNAETNASLPAAGGTTSTGFVGAYNGPNVLPTAFRLNGTVCTVL
jgi:hypothetical protein